MTQCPHCGFDIPRINIIFRAHFKYLDCPHCNTELKVVNPDWINLLIFGPDLVKEDKQLHEESVLPFSGDDWYKNIINAIKRKIGLKEKDKTKKSFKSYQRDDYKPIE